MQQNLPWTQKIYDEFIEDFPKYKNKLEIVYPAVPLNVEKKKITKKITLLFIGRYFFGKEDFTLWKQLID